MKRVGMLPRMYKGSKILASPYLDVADNGNILALYREYHYVKLLKIFDRDGNLLSETDSEALKKALDLKKPVSILGLVISRSGEMVYMKVHGGPYSVLLAYGTDGDIWAAWKSKTLIIDFDVSDDGLMGVALHGGYGVLDPFEGPLWTRQGEVCSTSISRDGRYVGFFSELKSKKGEKPAVEVYTVQGKLKWRWVGEEDDGVYSGKIFVFNDASAVVHYFYREGDEHFHRVLFLRDGKASAMVEGELRGASPGGETILIKRGRKLLVVDGSGEIKKIITPAPDWAYLVDVAYDGSFVVATGNVFRLYSPSGELLHEEKLPGYIFRVSISPNGKYCAILTESWEVYLLSVEGKSTGSSGEEKIPAPVINLEVWHPNRLPYQSYSLIRFKISSNSFVGDLELDLGYLTYYFDVFYRGEKLTGSKLKLPPLLPGVVLEEKLKLKPRYTGVFPVKLVLKAGNSRVEKAIELKVVDSPLPPLGESADLEKYYEFLGLIGEGGFAKVYKVKRKRDNLLVALKVPKKVDRYIGKLFVREIEAWRKVNDHPNVVRLLDFSVVPMYIEMELCDYSLDKLLDERGSLSVDETVSIILPILSAVEYAHSKKIIHRDIKPSNILFKGGVPKLSDWGIAKIAHSSGNLSITGTPQYKAPEQFFPKRFGHTDVRTDIWQIGVLMYEMLTGELPFGYDMDEVQENIERRISPRRPSEINPETSNLDGVITKCLQFDKSRRFQSISELKRAISQVVSLGTI